MKIVLYIHGFNSAGSTKKIAFLKEHGFEVHALSLSYVPNQAIRQLENFIEKNDSEEVYLVGMSLGGFYAVYLTEKYSGIKKTLLLNPSINAHQNFQGRFGEYVNYKTNEKYVFAKEHIYQLDKYKTEISNKDKYLAIIGRNDTVVDPKTAMVTFNHILTDDEHRMASIENYRTEILRFFE